MEALHTASCPGASSRIDSPGILVFADSTDPSALKKLLVNGGTLPADTIVIATEMQPALAYREAGFQTSTGLEDKSDQEKIDANIECFKALRHAYERADTGEDSSRIGRLSYNGIAEYFLYPAFVRTYRNLTIIDAALDTYKSPRIIVDGAGPFARMARTILSDRGLVFESLSGALGNRIATACRDFLSGARIAWPNTNFRNCVYEWFQVAVIFTRSVLWRLRHRLVLRNDPCKPVLVFSADRQSLSIVKELSRTDDWDYMVFGPDVGLRKRQFSRIVPLEGYAGPAVLIDTILAFGLFAVRAVTLAFSGAYQARFSYSGISYWPFVRRDILSNMVFSFARCHMIYLTALRSLKRLPRNSQIIMHSDELPYYRAIIEAARETGINTIASSHGVIGKNIGRRMYTDYYFAWGALAVDIIKGERHDVKCVVVGSPRYEAEYQPEAIPRGVADFKKELCIPLDKKLILLMTEWADNSMIEMMDAEDLMMIDAVCGALDRLPDGADYYTVIKPHPTSDASLYERYRRSKGFRDAKVISGRLGELIDAADLCITRYSSVTTDAILKGKPCIVFHRLIRPENIPYEAFGVALRATNAEEMACAINAIMKTPAFLDGLVERQKEFSYAAIHRLDGSSRRVAQALRSMANGDVPPGYLN